MGGVLLQLHVEEDMAVLRLVDRDVARVRLPGQLRGAQPRQVVHGVDVIDVHAKTTRSSRPGLSRGLHPRRVEQPPGTNGTGACAGHDTVWVLREAGSSSARVVAGE